MNFQEALTELKNGKSIKRTEWAEYVTIDGERNWPRMGECMWVTAFKIEDIMADDWQIA